MVCVLLAVALFIFYGSVPVSAATVPQTLKVYVQYWGDADSTVLLGEYSRGELESLASSAHYGYEGYYCNVTRVCTVMRIHARGVKLKEFLRDYVGVDLNSVRQIDFHTTDVAADARFVSKGRWELLDSTRYYYPNIIENTHVDYELYERVVDDEAAALEGAVVVPTILATVQYATKNANDRMTAAMTESASFRLCAGQPDLTTKTSFESAKWVDAIYVVLAGSPPEETTKPVETTKPSGTNEKESTTKEGLTSNKKETTTSVEKVTIGSKTKKNKDLYKTETNSKESNEDSKLKDENTTLSSTINGGDTLSGEKLGQLVIDDYGSIINWKEESSDDIVALQKAAVTTDGARNALIFVGTSFFMGASAMFIWFKRES